LRLPTRAQAEASAYSSERREIGERFRAFETAIQSHLAVMACLEKLRSLDLVLTFAGINLT
jgi:hypothetical protein